MTILRLDDSYDEPTPIPGSGIEAHEVQLPAWASALLDELQSVRIRIFRAWSTYWRLPAIRRRWALRDRMTRWRGQTVDDRLLRIRITHYP